MERHKTVFLAAGIILFLDQLTKYLSHQYLNEKSIELTGFLSLSSVKNTGAAFSMFLGNNTILIFVGLVFLGGLLFFMDTFPNTKWVNVFLGFIVGGGAGNILDRIIYGGVVDMIDFSFWPTFNLADSALSIGVIGFFILITIIENKKKSTPS